MEIVRCPWVVSGDLDYEAYHDAEWGVAVHDDRLHFEMLTLEGAQAGLSWRTILKKRANYRRAFAGFDPEAVARFGPAEVAALMQDSGIVRNRLKIGSTIDNARAFLRIQEASGSFDAFIWRYVDEAPILNAFRGPKDVPAQTGISDRMSKDLKKAGFRFVGSTIVYAYMQAIGMVNDHTEGCFRYRSSGDSR